MATRILEGTWEEIEQQAEKFAGRTVRLWVLDDKRSAVPNKKAIDVIRKIKEKQKDQDFTAGESGVDIVNRGRAGEMFDNDHK